MLVRAIVAKFVPEADIKVVTLERFDVPPVKDKVVIVDVTPFANWTKAGDSIVRLVIVLVSENAMPILVLSVAARTMIFS